MPSLHNRINKEELKARLAADDLARTTLSFYRYHHIDDPHALRDAWYRDMETLGVLGRIYVASEGVNAQLSVPTDRLADLRDFLYGHDWLDQERLNIAIEDDGKSFFKLTIKVRPKIVADGLEDRAVDLERRGIPLDARSYNQISAQDDTTIVDMRNHYESEVGYFEGAIRPDVETFRESLPKVRKMLKGREQQPLIMYCTGGIRCEKASAYFRQQGFEQVYMVEGGIIEYTRQCAEQGLPNKFVGKNFVFDDRMGERISEDVVAHCHQCGQPADTHVNCANDACHLLFIQCPACAQKMQGCCSTECLTYSQLPQEERERTRLDHRFPGQYLSKGKPGDLLFFEEVQEPESC